MRSRRSAFSGFVGGCILLYDLAGDIGGEASFDDIVGGCILLYGLVVLASQGVRDSGATCYRSF